ncbi:MAG: SRPBCC family protein [Acidimicrobiia bacterium]|nr:SRPBCC family protein [Acidimicrobiia bacterium]
MKIDQQFHVPVDPDAAYALLTDVERIAPCMPGAQLQEVAGDEYHGIVKVKVGPISTQYKGSATFVERDPSSRTAIVKASGRDTRGQGNASATIRMAVDEHGDGAEVSIVTDLNITGKVAQLGRGAISDVSAKLLGKFVESLGELVAQEGATASAGSGSASADVAVGVQHAQVGNGRQGPPERRVISQPEPEPVELLDVAGPALVRRAVPTAILLVVLLLLWRAGRRRRTRREG